MFTIVTYGKQSNNFLTFPAHGDSNREPLNIDHFLEQISDYKLFNFVTLKRSNLTKIYSLSRLLLSCIKRLYEIVMNIDETHETKLDVIENCSDFIKFVDKHDKRHETNFLKTFSEMEEEYHEWSKL